MLRDSIININPFIADVVYIYMFREDNHPAANDVNMSGLSGSAQLFLQLLIRQRNHNNYMKTTWFWEADLKIAWIFYEIHAKISI